MVLQHGDIGPFIFYFMHSVFFFLVFADQLVCFSLLVLHGVVYLEKLYFRAIALLPRFVTSEIDESISLNNCIARKILILVRLIYVFILEHIIDESYF